MTTEASQGAVGSKASGLRRRILTFGVAIVALAFVAVVVPIRDRCVVPAGDATLEPTKERVALSRESTGCILHTSAGDRYVSVSECEHLECEPGLASTLARTNKLLLALLALVSAASILAWSARWHSLLRLANAKVSVWYAWRVTLEAQAAGVLLPGGVAGDAVRIVSLTGQGVPTATVAASVLLDRAIGLSTMAGLAAALAAASEPDAIGPAVVVLGAIPLGVMLGLALLRAGPLRRAKIFEHRLLVHSAKPVLDYLGDPGAPRALARAFAWSLIVSAAQLGIVRGLVTALGVTPNPSRWVYTGAAISFIAAAIPALPGGWGTSDAAFVVFLARAGIPAPAALSVSLLYRLYWYLSSVTGAILFLARARRTKKDATSK